LIFVCYQTGAAPEEEKKESSDSEEDTLDAFMSNLVRLGKVRLGEVR
jgi:hypothetical protein